MHDFETGELATNGKRSPRLRRWKPKRWQPEYDKMVILSVQGLGNKQIGDILGYTKEHVSNVLNLDQAEEMRLEYQKRLREKAATDIPGQLGKIAEKTVERIYMAIHSDELFEKSPFAVIDRGMKVIEGLGHLKQDSESSSSGISVAGNAQFLIGNEFANKLLEGLEKSNQVRELHPDQKKLTQGDGDK